MENPILLDIIIRDLPPSINKMYVNGRGGRRFKTKEAVEFSKFVVLSIQLENPGFKIPLDTALDFYLVCFYPEWRFKLHGDPLFKNDSDNRLKAAKDAVFEASMCDEINLEYPDDHQVYDDYPKKRRGNPELLQLYPKGYCRMILAKHGYWKKILPMVN